MQRSTRIYLSIDNETLKSIGWQFQRENVFDNWVSSFLEAVKAKVVVDNQVNLNVLRGRNVNGLPRGVAFLVIMVLAANDMAEEVEVSESNYFKRLREILNLKGYGRPSGMTNGSNAEEPLWKEWNYWLMENGFEASAIRGNGGRMTYINYPISQSLLRRTDKDRLLVLFNEKQWRVQWDALNLFSQIRRLREQLPSHLRELVTSNKERHEAIADRIHEVHQQWLAEGRPNVLNGKVCNLNNRIFAGLYRDEDILFGSVNYYLYPKQVRGRQVTTIKLQNEDKTYDLIEERPGWYLPLDFQLSASDLENGQEYSITQPTEIKSLILPSRDFWILIPDPDSPDAGTYATWGQPPLGTLFILLCKKELLPDMERLRDEKLISWDEEVEPFDNSNWIELHQCMVTSQAWDGIFIKNQSLKDALQPSVSLSISFSDGLRIPKQNAFCHGYAPKVTVFGFYPQVELKVTRIIDNSLIFKTNVCTNIANTIEWAAPGDYIVSAICGNKSTSRFIKIVDWDSLTIEKNYIYEHISIDSMNCICGSLIKSL
jgi:hypothetical protein